MAGSTYVPGPIGVLHCATTTFRTAAREDMQGLLIVDLRQLEARLFRYVPRLAQNSAHVAECRAD